jgi:hypothetical protein
LKCRNQKRRIARGQRGDNSGSALRFAFGSAHPTRIRKQPADGSPARRRGTGRQFGEETREVNGGAEGVCVDLRRSVSRDSQQGNMTMNEILPGFSISHFRLTLMPREMIRLPRVNKGITLRGAFGTAFRSLVCAQREATCDACELHPTCLRDKASP